MYLHCFISRGYNAVEERREMKVSSIRETELKLILEMHVRIIPFIFTGFRAASHSILYLDILHRKIHKHI